MRDPDLTRGATQGDVRTLVLPSGGTISIPLPGSKAQFMIKPAGLSGGGSRGGAIVVGIVIGAVVATAATAWFLSRR